jgi:hypothetical protein
MVILQLLSVQNEDNHEHFRIIGISAEHRNGYLRKIGWKHYGFVSLYSVSDIALITNANIFN